MSSDRLKSHKSKASSRGTNSISRSTFAAADGKKQDDNNIARVITGDTRNNKSKRSKRRSPTTVAPAGGADGKVEGAPPRLSKKGTSIHSELGMEEYACRLGAKRLGFGSALLLPCLAHASGAVFS